MRDKEKLLALIEDVTLGMQYDKICVSILLHNENGTYATYTAFEEDGIHILKKLLKETSTTDIRQLKGKVVHALYVDRTLLTIKTIPFYSE